MPKSPYTPTPVPNAGEKYTGMLYSCADAVLAVRLATNPTSAILPRMRFISPLQYRFAASLSETQMGASNSSFTTAAHTVGSFTL
jgi:hypothetical protein